MFALADASAFLDPPRADIPGDPPPDINTQGQIIWRAESYLNTIIPRLPNFFARRTLVQYEETAQSYQGYGRFITAEPLHVVDSSKSTVQYRNGIELVNTKTLLDKKKDQHLTTYGTFGPVLGAIRRALSIGVTWKRWEGSADGGRLAIFQFAVPAAVSRYKTGGCCLPDGDGTISFVKMTAYQGKIAIDPTSGAILRVEIQADLNGFVPLNRAEVMVIYGRLEIGGKSYICPLRSVNIWRARSVNTLLEWNTAGFLTWGPYATKLNDIRYNDYHEFRSESRVLRGYVPTKE